MYKYREKTMFSNEAALDVMAEDFDQAMSELVKDEIHKQWVIEMELFFFGIIQGTYLAR